MIYDSYNRSRCAFISKHFGSNHSRNVMWKLTNNKKFVYHFIFSNKNFFQADIWRRFVFANITSSRISWAKKWRFIVVFLQWLRVKCCHLLWLALLPGKATHISPVCKCRFMLNHYPYLSIWSHEAWQSYTPANKLSKTKNNTNVFNRRQNAVFTCQTRPFLGISFGKIDVLSRNAKPQRKIIFLRNIKS